MTQTFPRLTADQIERRVERETDKIDAAFMAGRLSQAEYDTEMKSLSEWADREYAR